MAKRFSLVITGIHEYKRIRKELAAEEFKEIAAPFSKIAETEPMKVLANLITPPVDDSPMIANSNEGKALIDSDKDEIDDDDKPVKPTPPKSSPSDMITDRYKSTDDAPELAQVIKNAIQQYTKLGGDKSKLLQDLQSANNQK